MSLTMNLDAIAPYYSVYWFGILRSTIADGVPMPSVRLEWCSREISDVHSCTHDLLNYHFPDKSAEDWKYVHSQKDYYKDKEAQVLK